MFLGEVKNPGLLHAGHTHTCAAWGVGEKRQGGQRVGRRGKNDGWGNGARSMAPGLGFSAGTHIQSIVSILIVGKNIKWGDNVMLHFVEVQFREVVDLGRVAERGAECDSL